MAKEIASDISVTNSKELNVELRNILKKLIRDKGTTVAHLSRTTKIPLQTLHGWLHGAEPKSLRQIKTVADYFDVDLDYLCFGIIPKKEKSKIEELREEINAGIFEVVLRRVKSGKKE